MAEDQPTDFNSAENPVASGSNLTSEAKGDIIQGDSATVKVKKKKSAIREWIEAFSFSYSVCLIDSYGKLGRAYGLGVAWLSYA